jgi:hypothetical protein
MYKCNKRAFDNLFGQLETEMTDKLRRLMVAYGARRAVACGRCIPATPRRKHTASAGIDAVGFPSMR